MKVHATSSNDRPAVVFWGLSPRPASRLAPLLRFWLATALFASAFVATPSFAAGERRVTPAVRPTDTHPVVTLLAGAFFGAGLRWNNPYRLATPLGGSAESVSRSAAYTEFGFAAAVGAPFGLQHGLGLRWATALEGIGQTVFTPSYLAWRRFDRWALLGRIGLPVVLSPDTTWGGELALGGAYFVRGGIAIAGELVGDLFYGAGTTEVATPAYPILAGQLGILVSYEVWP